jgi:hypothetical protein
VILLLRISTFGTYTLWIAAKLFEDANHDHRHEANFDGLTWLLCKSDEFRQRMYLIGSDILHLVQLSFPEVTAGEAIR